MDSMGCLEIEMVDAGFDGLRETEDCTIGDCEANRSK